MLHLKDKIIIIEYNGTKRVHMLKDILHVSNTYNKSYVTLIKYIPEIFNFFSHSNISVVYHPLCQLSLSIN